MLSIRYSNDFLGGCKRVGGSLKDDSGRSRMHPGGWAAGF